METSKLTREFVIPDLLPLNLRRWGTWWRAWTSTSFTLRTCWVRTVSQCTPLCWTHMCIWLGKTPPASPTSAWRSSWTRPAAPAPANQRRPGSGIAATGSGSTSTSTAQERPPHHYSDQWFRASSLQSGVCVFGGQFFSACFGGSHPLQRDWLRPSPTNHPILSLLWPAESGWTQGSAPHWVDDDACVWRLIGGGVPLSLPPPCSYSPLAAILFPPARNGLPRVGGEDRKTVELVTVYRVMCKLWLDVQDTTKTEHLYSISIEKGGDWSYVQLAATRWNCWHILAF